MKYFILLLLTILFTSCSGGGKYYYTHHLPSKGPTINIWIDKEFGEQDSLSIADAVEQWNYSLNGQITLKIMDERFWMQNEIIERVMNGGGWLILKIDDKSAWVRGWKGYKVLAFADKVGGNRIFIVRDRIRRQEEVRGIAMHELGHLLGSNHLDDGLMSVPYSDKDSQCIDQKTVDAVANFRNLNLKNLNHCFY